MAEYKFEASPRAASGKKGARGLRGADKLPAVVYGAGIKPYTIEVSAKEIPLLYLRTLGKNALLTMELTDAKGAKSQSTVMFKDVQREPVKNKFQHVDFYHVDPKHAIKLKVPVVLDGIPVGVREAGGILNHPTRNLVVKCLPADIPTEIRVDVSGLGLDESLLLEAVKPPKGVTFLGDSHIVLAQVTAVEEEKAPEPAAGAAAAGPEVITAKKGEEAAAPAGKDAKAAPAAKDAKAAPAAKAPAKK
jgi:large subunit ribosomal protein L25